jgi:hypothetical protein
MKEDMGEDMKEEGKEEILIWCPYHEARGIHGSDPHCHSDCSNYYGTDWADEPCSVYYK